MDRVKVRKLLTRLGISQEEEVALTLSEVAKQLESFNKVINIQPLIDSLNSLKQDFTAKTEELLNSLDSKQTELTALIEKNELGNEEKISQLNAEVAVLSARKIEIPDFGRQIRDTESKLSAMVETAKVMDKLEDEKEKQELQIQFANFEKQVKDLRLQLQKHGGGSMNRKISVNGTVISTRYTDINFKAGANVTLAKADNNATKQADFTIASTGGAGASWTAGSFTGNGVTTVFTLPSAATSYASAFLHLNGQFLSDKNIVASGYDYTLAGDNVTITMVTAPLSSDKFIYNFS